MPTPWGLSNSFTFGQIDKLGLHTYNYGMNTADIIKRDAASCRDPNVRKLLFAIAKSLDAGMELEDCIALLKSVRKRKKQSEKDE